MAKITYNDKSDWQESQFADEYKVTANDMNEIKQVVNENYDEINGDIFYKPGDTYVIDGGSTTTGMVLGGFLTTAKTDYNFSIFTPKSLKNITSITFSGYITVRQNGNYLVGTASVKDTGDFVCSKISDNCFRCVHRGTAVASAINNETIGVIVSGTVTFN